MTLWTADDPLSGEWEQTAVRAEDGATFRRVSRSWHEAGSDIEHTEDLYRLLIDGEVIAEEVHRRSPATRSYTQEQARSLFESIGFNPVEIYSQFTFEPVKADDTIFTIVAHKATQR